MLCSVALLNLRQVKRGGNGRAEMLPPPHTGSFTPHDPSSPAHGVVIVGVTEAGGLQLAAHHGAGALVARQVALKSTLAVHAGTCDTADESQRGACWFRPPTPTFFDHIVAFALS